MADQSDMSADAVTASEDRTPSNTPSPNEAFTSRPPNAEQHEPKDTPGSSTNTTNETEKENEEIKLDEEGLHTNGYDVILYGTGLTQSILASALTRAGKSILHCDGNDFYGEKDAVFSLGSLMEWTKTKTNTKTDDMHDSAMSDDSDLKKSISLNDGGTISSIQIHSETHADTGNHHHLQKGMDVVTPYGQGRIISFPSTPNHNNNAQTYVSLPIQLKNWTLANGKSPIAYFGYHNTQEIANNDEQKEDEQNTIIKISKYYAQNHDIIPLKQFQFQKYILAKKRSFALDLTPGLLYANGVEVAGLVKSGVAEYCEFKSLLGLYLFMKNDRSSSKMSSNLKRKVSLRTKITKNSNTSSSASNTNDNNDNSSKNDDSFQLSRVPCSKRDVFQTKLLSPVEKRKLMKFLQIATDYAFAKAGTATSSSDDDNENQPNTSTSNDAGSSSSSSTLTNATTTAVEEEVLTSLNERQLQQGRSLYRPQNKSVSTSDLERLRQCIHEGMDFLTYLESEHKLTPRLRDIVIYAMSLASNTEGDNSTDLYSTKEGMNDLSSHLQSLGRYGGTAFLVPLYGAGELSQAFCRSAAVHGGTYLLRRALKRVNFDEDGGGKTCSVTLNSPSYEEEEDIPSKTPLKEIPTKHVVIPQESVELQTMTKSSSQKTLRRISILKGKLLLDETSASSNSEQRHIIIVPPKTIGNKNVIHGIALDETANVAPYYYGDSFTTTILHLTTVIDEKDIPSNDDEDILQKAMQSLIENKQTKTTQSIVEEIYHISFSSNMMSSTTQIQRPGLHICNKFGPSVTVQSAFLEASSIFHNICPNAEFLKLSKVMDEKVKESRFGLTEDENDMEKAVLESAMDMVISTAASDEKYD